MKSMLAAVSAFALASLLGIGIANAVDDGETRAMEYHQRQARCATVPRFGEQPVLVGVKTGDLEKDTIAFPVTNLETSCTSEQTRATENTGLQLRNAASKGQ